MKKLPAFKSYDEFLINKWFNMNYIFVTILYLSTYIFLIITFKKFMRIYKNNKLDTRLIIY